MRCCGALAVWPLAATVAPAWVAPYWAPELPGSGWTCNPLSTAKPFGKEPSQNNFSRFVLVLDSLVPESPVFCMGMPRILGEGQIPHTLRSTCFVKPRPLDGEHQSPLCRIQRS